MDCTIVDDEFPNEYQYQCKLVGSLLRAVPSVIVNHSHEPTFANVNSSKCLL